MLAHRIPFPPHTGDKVRAYHIARHLARRHELTLAFLVDEPADLAGIGPLGEITRRVEFARLSKPWGLVKGLAGLAVGGSLTRPYFASRRLRRRLERRMAAVDYDLVYVSSSPMAQYVADVEVPVVMDFVDVDSDKWAQYGRRTRAPLRWLYRAESAGLRRDEGRIARWARLCLLSTPVEEALLKSFAPWAKTAVIPNGVDVEFYSPVGGTPAAPTVIFTGAMDYRPNIDAVEHFCADIYPLIRREVPEVRFLIVGLNPAPAVTALSALPGVAVTGAVSDVRPYYAEASVAVAPLRIARGVQNKVLQAMAMGLPVVASTLAARGLSARPGEHLHVEEDPASFAARVVRLLQTPDDRAELGRRGRGFIEAYHSWEAALTPLDSLVAQAAAAGPTRAPARPKAVLGMRGVTRP